MAVDKKLQALEDALGREKKLISDLSQEYKTLNRIQDERLKSEFKIAQASKQEYDTLEARLKKAQELHNLAKEHLEISNRSANNLKQEAKEIKRLLIINKKKIADLEVESKFRANFNADLKDELAKNEKKLEGLKKQVKQGQLRLETIKEEIKLDVVSREGRKEQYLKEEQITKVLLKRVEILKNMRDSAGGMGKITSWMGIAAKEQDTFLYKVIETIGVLKGTGGMKDALEAVGTGMRQIITPTSVLSSFLSKVAESTILVSKNMLNMASDLSKATGTANDLDKRTVSLYMDSTQFAISVEEAGKVMGGLFNNMSKYTLLSDEAKTSTEALTAALVGMGIDANKAASNIDDTMRVFQMSNDQALEVQKQLAATAKYVGISQQKMADDWSSAMPKLAAQGDKAVQIFKEMEEQSKATGLAVNDLLGIVGQFDTFEGAARAAGKLNAVFGGNLINSVDLLAASEERRVEMLRETMKASGQVWGQLSKFEKITVASAAGISDMNQAAKLFGASDADFAKVSKASEQLAMTQKEMSEISLSSASVQQKLLLIIQKFGIALSPVITVINKLMNGILWLQEKMGNWFGVLLAGTAIVWAYYKSLVMANIIKKLLSLTTSQSIATTAKETAAKLWNKLVTDKQTQSEVQHTAAQNIGNTAKTKGVAAQGAINASMATGAATILAYGAALAMAGIAIGAAAGGLSLMAKALKDLGPLQLAVFGTTSIALIASFVFMLKTLTTSALFSVKPMYALGGAMLMIGGSIALASAGLALLIMSIQQLAGAGWGEMGKAALILIGLSAAVVLLGLAGKIGSIGLIIITAAMLGISAAIWIVSQAFKTVITSVEMLINNVPGLLMVTGAFMVLAQAMMAMVIAGPLAGLALIGLSIATALFGLSLRTMNEDVLESFGKVMSGVEALSKMSASGIREIGSALSSVAEATVKFSGEAYTTAANNIYKLSSALRSVTELASLGGEATITNISRMAEPLNAIVSTANTSVPIATRNIEKVTTQVSRYSSVNTGSSGGTTATTPANDALTVAVKQLTALIASQRSSGGSKPAHSTGEGDVLVLKVGEKEFGRIVLGVLAQENRLDMAIA